MCGQGHPLEGNPRGGPSATPFLNAIMFNFWVLRKNDGAYRPRALFAQRRTPKIILNHPG
eukprot:15055215-Heterocapsa_arctica.AAC.1